MPLDPALAAESYCYLTTTGRTSGLPRTIEIWFAARGDKIYLLSGGRDNAHWVKNLRQDPRVKVRIGRRDFPGHARLARGGEVPLARRLLLEKYSGGSEGNLSGWGRTSLPIAIQLSA